MSKSGLMEYVRRSGATKRLQRAWTALVLNDVADYRERVGFYPKADRSTEPSVPSWWGDFSVVREDLRLALAEGDHEIVRETLVRLAGLAVGWVEDLDQREQQRLAEDERARQVGFNATDGREVTGVHFTAHNTVNQTDEE